MNPILFLSLLIGTSFTFFVIGLYFSRKNKNQTDYFLAGRTLTLWPITLSLVATQLGGNMMMGTSEWAYQYGLYGTLYTFGIILGFILLASGFAAKLNACNVGTTAELFETKYNSTLLRKLASAISIVSLWGVLVSIVISSKTLINGLGIDNEPIFLLFWFLTIGYTIIGGFYAVVVTDIVQVLFIFGSVGFLFLYCVFYNPQPLLSVRSLVTNMNLFSTDGLTNAKLIATIMMPALYCLIEQDMAQRFFASKSQRTAILSALLSGLLLLAFGFVPVYFGMQARAIGLSIPSGGSPFVALLEILTNDLFFAIAVCGVIAAITSTADSLLSAISSNLAQDFWTFSSQKRSVQVSQLATLVTGLSAIAASYFISQSILDVSISSYELAISCLLVPLVFALYKKNLSEKAAIGSIIFGITGFILYRYIPTPIPKEIATLGLSYIGYIIGSKL